MNRAQYLLVHGDLIIVSLLGLLFMLMSERDKLSQLTLVGGEVTQDFDLFALSRHGCLQASILSLEFSNGVIPRLDAGITVMDIAAQRLDGGLGV